MKKRTWSIVGSVILLIILLAVAKKAGWIGKSDEIEVEVEAVTRRTIIETVSTNGNIQPETEVKISADVSGEIVELKVKEGQKVQKGEHLLTINPDLIKAAAERVEATLNQARANLSNTKARLVQAEANFGATELSFKRSKKLYEQKAISDAEYETAEAQYNSSKAELEAARQTVLAADFSVRSAQASLKEANDNLARTRIYAPADGTVSKLNVELGERVVGTAQMSGTELLRIANMNEMEVNVKISENDIVRIQPGDTALIEVEAYQKRKFTGTITEIARSSVSSGLPTDNGDKVVNFEVKIRILRESYADLLKPDQPHLSPFFPGMTATVDIRTQTARNVLSLPIMAVTTRTIAELEKKNEQNTKANNKASEQEREPEEEELKEVVFVYDNGKVHPVEVETSIQDENYIQIAKGVKEGQMVVKSPISAITRMLKDNMSVKLKKDEGTSPQK